MYNILVVDDEARIRSLIKKYAEFEGHTISEASDGMEAVYMCRNNKYDIIIMIVIRGNFLIGALRVENGRRLAIWLNELKI